MLISIIIPAFNMARFIGECLESVGEQLYSHWEVIVVEDASDDGTKEIVEKFAEKYPERRVLYERHSENRGVSAARNSALSKIRGEIIAFLDPDDLWTPDHLERHISRYQDAKHVDLVTSMSRMFQDGTDPKLGRKRGPDSCERRSFPFSLINYNYITLSGTSCRAELCSCEKVFDESPGIQHVEDWDLWIRLSQAGCSFIFLDEVSCFHRRHQLGATSRLDGMMAEKLCLYRKHSDYIAYCQSQMIRMIALEIENRKGVSRLLRESVLWKYMARAWRSLSGNQGK